MAQATLRATRTPSQLPFLERVPLESTAVRPPGTAPTPPEYSPQPLICQRSPPLENQPSRLDGETTARLVAPSSGVGFGLGLGLSPSSPPRMSSVLAPAQPCWMCAHGRQGALSSGDADRANACSSQESESSSRRAFPPPALIHQDGYTEVAPLCSLLDCKTSCATLCGLNSCPFFPVQAHGQPLALLSTGVNFSCV